MAWERFVAVGDSFTEGMHDGPGPDGAFVGWADRAAARLSRSNPRLTYANLAVRGKLLEQVLADQVPLVHTLAPDLLTFHAGGNDVLRPGIEVADAVAAYDAAVAQVTAPGRTVVLFTVLERSGRAGRMGDRLAARISRFNEGVRVTAERHGAVLVDLAAEPVMTERRLWHVDRLHLAPAGHQRVAAALLEALDVRDPVPGGAGWWRTPLPAPGPLNAAGRIRDEARWVSGHLAPWVWRRLRGVSSGDGRTAKRPDLGPWTWPE